MMKHAAVILARSGILNEIWLSTDDISIANIAIRYNTNIKIHIRLDQYSDESSSIDSLQEFLSQHSDIDVVYTIQCTSPCLHHKYLQQAYEIMKDGYYDSIFSVTRSHQLRWSITDTNKLIPQNFDPLHRPRKQDWPGDIVESGHFYVATKQLILEKHLLQSGCKSKFIEIPQEYSFELDYEWQIPIIELMVKKFYDEHTDLCPNE